MWRLRAIADGRSQRSRIDDISFLIDQRFGGHSYRWGCYRCIDGLLSSSTVTVCLRSRRSRRSNCQRMSERGLGASEARASAIFECFEVASLRIRRRIAIVTLLSPRKFLESHAVKQSIECPLNIATNQLASPPAVLALLLFSNLHIMKLSLEHVVAASL